MLSLFLTAALVANTLAAPAVVVGPRADTACTREALKAHAATLIAAQTAGKPDSIVALTGPDFVYTEDAKSADLAKGVLTLPLRIDHSRSIYDTTQCATYSEIISTDPKNPRVVGTQMRFDSSASKLTKIETLVTMQGDWLFNATATNMYASREDTLWTEIPEAQRDSRAVIQAAGDAYLDLFNNKSTVVPWGTPCQRLEGGAYTGRGSPSDSCNVGVPSGVPIVNRRYVIDEVLGTVDAFVTFASVPDSHEFRVEKGKLRLVHTLTVMRK
ncbi:hypothetical protein B0H66DRAFT_470056 [Apodospora peruviana]|uniref:DUF8021 domain-containing protein n=1 Tax=Apodospora peruviana TaxID=516989 RepID=A0AAE0MC09_9PEZI|nr:hypothetical protein B0H66DRAFT_470056 [Apodospora peruviana]